MWKLLIIVFLMDDAGQSVPVEGEHPQTFASAQECYEAAADFYLDSSERVVGVSTLCARELGREA